MDVSYENGKISSPDFEWGNITVQSLQIFKVLIKS
jgi:hypothetical protein